MFLTDVQVVSFRKLNKLLRRLKVIGVLEFEVVAKNITEFGRPKRYTISITGYHPGSYISTEDRIEEAEKQLEAVFRRSD